MLNWNDSVWNAVYWVCGVGAQLAEVIDSWLHMRKWAWVGCSLRDAQQHLSSRDGCGIWWPTRLLCQNLGQLLRVVAGTNHITRLHVHSLLSKHVAGHYPKRYEAISPLIFISCSGIWPGNVASQSTVQGCHLRRIFLELSLLSF